MNDLDALEETLAEQFPELELRRGQKSYRWYGKFMNDSRDYGSHDPKTFGRGEHAIGIRGDRTGYEIGLVADGAGGFAVLYDAWGPGHKLTELVGAGAAALKQEYAFTVASRKAKATLGRKGWTTSRERMPDGRLKLKLRKR